MKTLLYSPVWFFQLFTTAKSFSANPILGSPLLNRLGLHVLRVVLAHAVMQLRLWLLHWHIDPADRQSFREQGFILKPDYFPAEDFQRMEQELRHYKGHSRTYLQGDTRTLRTLLAPEALAQLPATRRQLADPAFLRLLCYANGHQRHPLFNTEQIFNGERGGAGDDPQKKLHVDTFHPTMKFWLYLDDVDAHNGTFVYIPGSQRLSWKRLRWEYRLSIRARTLPDLYATRGSFRVTEQDRLALGLPEPRAFAVPRNTLLIANTFGVHGRGPANPGSTRLALWGMGRTNPFIPFPGTGLPVFNRLQYRVLAWLENRK